MGDFVSRKQIEYHIIDVNLIKFNTSWQNKHIGNVMVAKRLDTFIMAEGLLARIHMFFLWIGSSCDFDHHPIFIELKGGSRKPGSHFKFNPSCLKEDSYIQLVKDTWIPFN